MLGIDQILDQIWIIIGFPALLALGVYFSVKSKLFQILKFPKILKTFFSYMQEDDSRKGGYHPLKMFFAAIGGCIGIGNLVGVCTAVKFGGPGAIFWVWVAAILGSLVKYTEVFLGMKFRVKQGNNYVGGPFYYLQSAFKYKHAAYLAAFFLCIYGVEVYTFSTIVNSFTLNWHLPHTLTVMIFLILVIIGVCGGLDRVGKISSAIVPLFIGLFFILGLVFIYKNINMLPSALSLIINSAIHGHAAVGGFIGSTVMMAVTQGVSWACYSGDIGIGYASVLHSASREQVPHKQAALTILGVFLDTFVVCTLSLLVIMVSKVWQTDLPVLFYIQNSLATIVPYMDIFMPILFGLLGYSTIIAYFGVGLQNAELLMGFKGKVIYFIYGIIGLTVFSYLSTDIAALIMRIAGVCLLILNIIGFYKLRKAVEFGL